MGQGIQEWTKLTLLKTALKKFGFLMFSGVIKKKKMVNENWRTMHSVRCIFIGNVQCFHGHKSQISNTGSL